MALTVPSAVSLRDEGFACRVDVEGVDIARRILACLSSVFVFKTSSPIEELSHPPQCSFRVAYGSQCSFRKLVAHLSAIPEVSLRMESLAEETVS